MKNNKVVIEGTELEYTIKNHGYNHGTLFGSLELEFYTSPKDFARFLDAQELISKLVREKHDVGLGEGKYLVDKWKITLELEELKEE